MNSIKEYKHYIALISALILVRFVIVPAWEQIELDAQKIRSLDSRLNRVENLISIKDELAQEYTQSQKKLNQVIPYIYNVPNESEFKLVAQKNIEAALGEAGCEIEQIGWEGYTSVSDNIRRWRIQARYKGLARCLLMSTRKIESLKPITRIDTFFYGGQEINRDINRPIAANLNLIVWQYDAGKQ